MSYIANTAKKTIIPVLMLITVLFTQVAYASSIDITVPTAWPRLKPILIARFTQNKPKMKLSKDQVISFVDFLDNLNSPTPKLKDLQIALPKTTLELLMAVHKRGLSLVEAEKMAAYLEQLVRKYKFQNANAFDENTSHIIGREWHEIDYTGENMTWQKQRLKYLPYGVVDFKTKEHLIKFFNLESQLPYFSKIYRPQG